MTMTCEQARLAIGGDPAHLPADVKQHVAGCAACARFLDETLRMETRLRAALELPLQRFRPQESRRPAARSRFAMAASLILALLVGGGAWVFWPQPALAREVVAHLREEPGSWGQAQPVPPERLAAVLAKAGVKYDARLPVVYASPCPFHGHIVPHLVVRTPHGPMTVMLLAHEKVERQQRFHSDGYRGVLLPAGDGSVAVITRGDQEMEADLDSVMKGIN
jgi:hypothetical protein